jgi:DNA-binding response OmpR family regulator
MKILIVEDEDALAESICSWLQNEDFVCERANNYATAVQKIELFDYGCIVLDINLPDGSGLQLLKQLKNDNKLDGVLIISARNSLDDKVYALKSGADDYLTKPFHLPELSARIAAIVRRKFFDGKNLIYFDALQIDLNRKELRINEQLVDLTRKEYQLLVYFLTNRNKVITKSAIATHLWGDYMDVAGNYDFIYTHIKNLRKKLVDAGAPDYIKSVYGMGYKFS